MSLIKDEKTGKFLRTRQPWTIENWDDGYIDNNGYFRVYRPDYPKSYKDGYAKRYHVVWWLNTGNVVENEIHHLDKNKLNDVFENIKYLTHEEHSKLHGGERKNIKNCNFCNKEFYSPKKQYIKKYCSLICYNSKPRSDEHKKNISKSLLKLAALKRVK